MKKKIILLSLLVSQIGFGQKNIGFKQLSKEDKKNFEIQVEKKVKELGKNLNILAGAPSFIKPKIIESQLRDFLENAMFEIGVKKNGKLNRIKQSVENYLKSLQKYSKKREIVDIEFASININSKLYKDPNKKDVYFFEYSFTQIFTKTKKQLKMNKEDLKNRNYSYKDRTKKNGKMYLKQVKTVLGNKWKLFFGDVYVEDVEIL